jgi:hypothetical protein
MCFPGPGPVVEGRLVPASTSGTAIQVESSSTGYTVPGTGLPPAESVVPVMWPGGYTGRRVGVEVQVLNEAGDVVATTGRRYRIDGQVQAAIAYDKSGPFPACAATAE